MGIRTKMRNRVAPHLAPGEDVRVVFGAQTMSGWFAALSWLIILFGNSYRLVAVTDRRILVFNSGKMSMAQTKSLLRELPLGTKIGPAHGIWYRTDALGEKLYVHKRFHKDVAEADAVAGAPAAPSAPPMAPTA